MNIKHKEHVDRNIYYWEKVFSRQEWGKYPPIELVRFIQKTFSFVENRGHIKILELGSGPGPNLWFMAREGFCVYGIDGSKSACESAYKRLKDENLSHNVGEIKIGDYFKKLDEFPDNYFDAIIDIESLYCNPFERTKDIIEKSFNKLKTSGKMFSITFANKEWLSDDEDIEYHAINNEEVRGYFRYTTREDIDTLYTSDISSLDMVEMSELHGSNGRSKQEWLVECTKI